MILAQTKVAADGVDWSLETFIDAYRYTRLPDPAPTFPRMFDFMAVLEDGAVLGPVAGYELNALVGRDLVAFLYLAGGADDVTFGACSTCHETHTLKNGECSSCSTADIFDGDDDHDDRCPHCGARL
ncbi:hypothetical protein [Novosphingobium sp. FSW06-99]|uniref:hypothetical protein n=1 Tax=Novosphingobium sp. FSW06-99 TaxID=1739113 RepID=UPI00076BCA5D|nr:hypothetical protein [Novosphingobium sp. FSW06-99]KUR80797.1 hypothetical protein AQZ49_01850 [Novosphingobium sp. FSW06-99]